MVETACEKWLACAFVKGSNAPYSTDLVSTAIQNENLRVAESVADGTW